jgi:AcrR family transcriptional regulator
MDLDQKQRIRRSAARLFAEKGYAATGVAELGETVGLGRGALYHHIGSKEDLLYQISMEHVVKLLQTGEEILASDLPAEEKFRMLARSLMSTIADNLPELTVFFADSRDLRGRHRRQVWKKREEFEAVWTAILAQGEQEGAFQHVDALLVKGILGMFNYSHLWLRPRGRKPEDIADSFSDLVIRGLRPVPID